MTSKDLIHDPFESGYAGHRTFGLAVFLILFFLFVRFATTTGEEIDERKFPLLDVDTVFIVRIRILDVFERFVLDRCRRFQILQIVLDVVVFNFRHQLLREPGGFRHLLGIVHDFKKATLPARDLHDNRSQETDSDNDFQQRKA
ncbi:MAG: hypothetical protein H7318_00475 [Oligoflexus sp.]|nr:hypothetical protein [Oligoflexus sp.]